MEGPTPDMRSADGSAGAPVFALKPRRVPFDAPWSWLAAGWRDMWRIPALSLGYGVIFAGSAAALAVALWSQGWNSLFLALAGGGLLIGPLFGVGLYDASRRLANGQPVRGAAMAAAGFGALKELAFFGAILMFCFLIWMQMAFLLLMLFLGTEGLPPASQFVPMLLFTPKGLGLLIVGSIVGGIIASCVFVVSAVSVPAMLAQPVDAVSAARASALAVKLNAKPMVLWAGLIAMMMAAGFATMFVGLVFAFPLIGHATWHAYADVYGQTAR
jgi:uncharacterized membrane protein